jgi:hypothetical protein
MWSMTRLFRAAVLAVVATLALAGCNSPLAFPTPTPTGGVFVDEEGNPIAIPTDAPQGPDTDPDVDSYWVTGGFGKYQFAGLLCDADSTGNWHAVGAEGKANYLGPDYGMGLSWNWIDGDGLTTASGVASITQIDFTTITLVSTYDGYAAIGDGGTNTAISGSMEFHGTAIPTPAEC